MFVLVTVVDREITIERFTSRKAARNQMITELKIAADYSEKEWSDAMEYYVREGRLDDGDIGLGEWTAYFNGIYNWDWKIFNLEEGK